MTAECSTPFLEVMVERKECEYKGSSMLEVKL